MERTPKKNLIEPVGLNAVVRAESDYLEQRRKLAGLAAPPAAGPAARRRPIGLALSGGGIRSATFGLGVLQALSMLRLLPKIDYLSTVSGGGYIGSCLSSLLSHRREPGGEIAGPDEKQEPYTIDPAKNQTAHFGTTPGLFPFNPEAMEQPDLKGFNGRSQLRHLRTRGDYLVVRSALFSRDLLRAIGNILGGLFWHILMFTQYLVAAATLFMALTVWWMGDLTQEDPALELGDYVWRLIDWSYTGSVLRHPMALAILTGAMVTFIAVPLIGALLRWMSDRYFRTDGRSVEDQREIKSLGLFVGLLGTVALGFPTMMTLRHGAQIDHVALPLGVIFGGQLAAIVLHAVVSNVGALTRNDRSRFSAVKGTISYMSIAALAAVFLPFITYRLWSAKADSPAVGTWVLSVLGAWWFTRSDQKASAIQPMAIVRWFRRLSASVRHAVLAVCVVVLAVGGGVLFDVFLLRLHATYGGSLFALASVTGLTSLATFLVLGSVLDFNNLSLHYFYRDRLAETYLQTYAQEDAGRSPDKAEQLGAEVKLRDDAEMLLMDLHGSLPKNKQTGAPACVSAAPYHLIVTSLNLTASRDTTRRDRKSDEFIFSKLYCGSKTTGYLPTAKYRNGETKLARVLTISGAAASSAMGRQTYFAEAFALTVFNVRLGQWMLNPRYQSAAKTYLDDGWVFWPHYLLREMFGLTDANQRLIHLSDGGHTGDNIGIGPLLKRRCALIIASDAEADPKYTFGSLCEALRQTYVDENIKVDLVVDGIRPDPLTGRSTSHHAIAKIRYPQTESLPAETGWLIVLKSSLTGDELARLADYRLANPEFPQQPTADQFFDDDQFESYRELGYHVAKHSLMAVPPAAWDCYEGTDWETVWAALAEPAAGTSKS